MARPSPAVARPRAVAGALSRCRPPDDPELLAAKRALATEMLAEHVERVVKQLGPLTDQQCQRIATILLQRRCSVTTGNNLGPPEKRRAGASPDAEPHHQQSAGSTHTDQIQDIAPVGRFARAWRTGFAYGFRDALRLAQREIDDPAVWVVLDRLAADYDLAAGRCA